MIVAEVNSRLASLIPARGHIRARELQLGVASLLYVVQADAIYDTLADWTDYAALEAAYIGTELTAKTTAALNTVLTQAPAFASS